MLGFIDRWRDRKAERAAHRDTAYNCRFWYGDNGPVDWGTCSLCDTGGNPND